MTDRRSFKDTFNSVSTPEKIALIVLAAILYSLYVFLVLPFIAVFKAMLYRDPIKGLASLITQDLLSPLGLLDLFFGD